MMQMWSWIRFKEQSIVSILWQGKCVSGWSVALHTCDGLPSLNTNILNKETYL